MFLIFSFPTFPLYIRMSRKTADMQKNQKIVNVWISTYPLYIFHMSFIFLFWQSCTWCSLVDFFSFVSAMTNINNLISNVLSKDETPNIAMIITIKNQKKILCHSKCFSILNPTFCLPICLFKMFVLSKNIACLFYSFANSLT